MGSRQKIQTRSYYKEFGSRPSRRSWDLSLDLGVHRVKANRLRTCSGSRDHRTI